MFDLSFILALIGVMLLAGALSNKLSSRFNVPILILFLILGGVLGYSYMPSDKGFQGINIFGTVAMSFILFSGGLDTSYKKIRDVLVPGGVLSTIGVLITAFLLGIGAYLIAGDMLLIPDPNGSTAANSSAKLICTALLHTPS